MAKGKIDDLSGGIKIAVQTVSEVDEDLLKKFGKVSFDEELAGGCYILEVEEDCRVELSKTLVESGYLIKELHMMEPSLEEMYFTMVEYF